MLWTRIRSKLRAQLGHVRWRRSPKDAASTSSSLSCGEEHDPKNPSKNDKKKKRDPRHELGAKGERAAAQFLKRAGYAILKKNVRIPGGEIDLIAESPNKKAIVFVEVKTRSNDAYRGELAINAAKRRRLIQLSQRLARKFNWQKRQLRIDVIAIAWEDLEQPPTIRHHPNAVTLGR